MDLALITGRLVLATTFGVADQTKLADRQGSRMAFVRFGVPDRWAGYFGMVLRQPASPTGASISKRARDL